MFSDNEKVCEYRVEYVQIVNLRSNVDIGISYFYDARKGTADCVYVTGIHLNKRCIMDQYQLIFPGHHCLRDRFQTQIDDLRIGNPDEDKNKYKDVKTRKDAAVTKYEEIIRRKDMEIQELRQQLSPGTASSSAKKPMRNANYYALTAQQCILLQQSQYNQLPSNVLHSNIPSIPPLSHANRRPTSHFLPQITPMASPVTTHSMYSTDTLPTPCLSPPNITPLASPVSALSSPTSQASRLEGTLVRRGNVAGSKSSNTPPQYVSEGYGNATRESSESPSVTVTCPLPELAPIQSQSHQYGKCNAIKRIREALQDYDNIHKKTDDGQLLYLCNTKHKSLLEDWIHVLAEHPKHPIVLHRKSHNILYCPIANRHYFNKMVHDINVETEVVFYRGLLDSMHCYVY
eukprot:198136_1